MQAFWQIHPMRFSQMGYRPLNIGDIMTYCKFNEIQGIEYRRWLWWLVNRLDQTWLELAEQDAERKRNQDEWEAKIASKTGAEL